MDMQCSHPNVVILAYLDDVFILGTEHDAFPDLKQSFGDLHLCIADRKCEIFAVAISRNRLLCPVNRSEQQFSELPSVNLNTSTTSASVFKKAEIGSKISSLGDPQCSLLFGIAT